MPRRCALAALCLIALAGLAAGPQAETYSVNPEGTGDYPTIQAAVDACVDGDIVELADGTYTGEGNRGITVMHLALTVRSQSGDPDRCVLDCEGESRGFTIGSPWHSVPVVEGLTVMNGSAYEAGAVDLLSGNAVFRRCIFADNHSESFGGAVITWDMSEARFEECTFAGNTATGAGAICI